MTVAPPGELIPATWSEASRAGARRDRSPEERELEELERRPRGKRSAAAESDVPGAQGNESGRGRDWLDLAAEAAAFGGLSTRNEPSASVPPQVRARVKIPAVSATLTLMRRLALTALMLAACNRDGDKMAFSTSITTAPPGTTSSGGDTSTATATSTSAAEDSAAASTASSSGSIISTSEGGIPDVGTIPDGGDGPPPGCKGKIDFVFTISGAPTMEPKQARLKASFPGFIATLESEFADFDYHILSANTAGFWGYPSCKGCQNTCADLPEFPCGVSPEPCDLVRGAGMTYPIGEGASNQRCELASGLRYITAGQPKLEDAFTCIASMGTNGADGVAGATVLALTDDINAPAGCNEDFLRDDALLVVVAIQDTFDQESEGTAEDWAAALVDAKGGDGDAVVLLVITTDVEDPDGLCGYTGTITPHELRTWTELLPHSVFGSICADGYTDYFAAAAAKIKSQCDVFVPQ